MHLFVSKRLYGSLGALYAKLIVCFKCLRRKEGEKKKKLHVQNLAVVGCEYLTSCSSGFNRKQSLNNICVQPVQTRTGYSGCFFVLLLKRSDGLSGGPRNFFVRRHTANVRRVKNHQGSPLSKDALTALVSLKHMKATAASILLTVGLSVLL